MDTIEDKDTLGELASYLSVVRRRLLFSVVIVIIFSIAGYRFAPDALHYVLRPVGGRVVFVGPAEAFIVRVKIALALGIVPALPIIGYQIMGLLMKRLPLAMRRSAAGYTAFAIILFLLGGAFAFFIAVPGCVHFLLGFGSLEVQPLLSADKYLSFVLTLVMVFGVVFQVPLGITILSRAGVVSSGTLAKKRKYAVLVIFIVSAILTPPDAFSQIVMALPLMALYEVGILVSRFLGR